MLKRSGERGQPCLAPDLSKKVSSFLPLSKMLTVRGGVVVDILYEVEEVPLYSCFTERFIVNGCLFFFL